MNFLLSPIEKVLIAVVGVMALIGGTIAWLSVHDAGVAAAARENYVQRSELDAANAKLAKAQHEVIFNALQADAARNAAAKSAQEANTANTALEKKIAAENDPNASRWTQLDLDRLQHNGETP